MERPGVEQDSFAQALESVSKRLRTDGTTIPFLIEIQGTYRQHPLYAGMLKVFARIIQPEDRSLGVDESSSPARAFFIGELIALHIASLRGGEELLHTMRGAKLISPDTSKETDKDHASHLVAASLMDLGNDFIHGNDTSSKFLDEHENKLCPSVSHQIYLKAGFGVVSHIAQESMTALELMKMTNEIDHVDWDAELRDLLG